MAPAWLDSLSEDWVSQPGSETSFSAPPASGSRKPSQSKASLKRQGLLSQKKPSTGTSRLPRFSSNGPAAAVASANNSSYILSERSISDRNIPESYRPAAVPPLPRPTQENEAPASTRKYLRRSFSASSTASASADGGSVVHNTVHQKPLSASLSKSKGMTPEWKRRLIHGELAYGEQRDLFSSAATGLENIFKPPPTPKPAAIQEEGDEEEEEEESQAPEHETTIPSSPPIIRPQSFIEESAVNNSTIEIHVDSSAISQQLPGENQQRGPGKMTYRLTDESALDDSQLSDGNPRAFQSSQAQEFVDSAASSERSDLFSADSFSQVPLPAATGESRKVSNGSVLRNEDFSPILLSRRSTENGTASFAPIDLPPHELRQRLEKLRSNHMILGETTTAAMAAANNPSIVIGNTSSGGQSLNMENTEDYEHMGGFINFRRGGLSAEGSFRRRPLSPELSANTSEMFPEESLQASTPKQFPSVRTDRTANVGETPPMPRVPHPSPEKAPPTTPARTQQPLASSGSPLKLFGPYDTFTNQTLLRRISQFEDQMTDGSGSPVHAAAMGASRFGASRLAANGSRAGQKSAHREHSALFGAGGLDGYEFNEQFPFQDSTFGPQGDETSLAADESLQSMQKPALDRSHESSPPVSPELVMNRRRGNAAAGSVSTKQSVQLDRSPDDSVFSQMQGDSTIPLVEDLRRMVPVTPDPRDHGFDSKRPRTSPTKDPTPKRRRTLHRSDISWVGDQQVAVLVETVQLSHKSMQSALGRKRRDARDGDFYEEAEPEVLASRQILRPRTPTPKSSVRTNPFVEDAAHAEADPVAESPSRRSRASPLRPGNPPPVEVERKPSIKTEDFINEANKIMAMIRGRSGPQSGLASVEESELEALEYPPVEGSSFQESTREPFSRPPSREGKPIPRATVRQEDPELVAKLRKYEEQSDIGDLIGSSVRSLGMAQDVIRVLREAELQIQDSMARSKARLSPDVEDSQAVSEDDVISDPPNIRISMAPSLQRQQSQEDAPSSIRSGDGSFPTTKSAASSSSGTSTSRSIPTSSSRGSDTRKTIAPQSVSHLIPDQVGNMVLDRDRNVWVKSRPERSPEKPRTHPSGHKNSSMLQSEVSEDDPFADIPDLTVDLTMEVRNLRNPTAPTELNSRPLVGNIAPPASPPKPAEPAASKSPSHRPTTPGRAQSSAESRATAWSPGKIMRHFAETTEDIEEGVEHEISLHEGRDAGQSSTAKRRNLTISFSSPVASIIQDAVAAANNSSMDSSSEDLSAHSVSLGSFSRHSFKRGRPVSAPSPGVNRSRTVSAALGSRSKSRGPARQVSVGTGHMFVPRPVSRIDELDEDNTASKQASEEDQHDLTRLSTDEDKQVSILVDTSVVVDRASSEKRSASLSFLVSTPARPHPLAQVHPAPAAVISQYVGTLSLSPLSDFTARYGEPSAALEASYIVDDQRFVTGDGSKRVMSQTLEELVARLAEVEPFEPYWEDMTTLDLPDKRLSSLHKLGDFCPKVSRLDVSNNAIRNLGGVPPSIRFLKVSGNQLSGLTAWGTLANLQYLDVSGNEIGTLSGLSQLVHLRNLKADNCGLTSLDGLMYHDGLVTLRARDNHIEEIDFDGANLQRLTELDLQGNGSLKVDNIEQLASLSDLNLEDNKLESFTSTSGEPLSSLKTLNLGGNDLTKLDVRCFPSLKLLHADRNRLHRIRGLKHAARLDSLSLREQRGDKPLDVFSFLASAGDVRKLFLSGNLLETFEPAVALPHLQLLELANCGLQRLPAATAKLMANLRRLNVNFNAISDLSPVGGLSRLRRLRAAGNRVADSMEVVRALETLPALADLDLRDNPATLGFYPPAHVAAVLQSGSGDNVADSSVLGSVLGDDTTTTLQSEDGKTKSTSSSLSPPSPSAATQGPFTLAMQDAERDTAYSGRLDKWTRMHRRLYQMVWAASCDKLQWLDGLPLRRDVATVRDSVWSALVEQGLVQGDNVVDVDVNVNNDDDSDELDESSTEATEVEEERREREEPEPKADADVTKAAEAEAEAKRLAMEAEAESNRIAMAKAQAEAEAQVKAEEARARAEAEVRVRIEAEQRTRAEAEERARKDAETRLRLEAELRAQAEIEQRVRAEQEQRAREEAEQRIREEAEQRAREEAERRVREEAEQRVREEAEQRIRQEAEQRIRQDAERRAQAEVEQRVRAEEEQRIRLQTEQRAREEAEQRAREEAAEEKVKIAAALAVAQARAEEEAKWAREIAAAKEAAALARAQDEEKWARELAAAREAVALAEARATTEEKARIAAAAALARAQAQSQAEAEERARATAAMEAIAKVRVELEAQVRASAAAAARAQAEEEEKIRAAQAARAQAEAEEKARAQAEEEHKRRELEAALAREKARAEEEERARVAAAEARARAQIELETQEKARAAAIAEAAAKIRAQAQAEAEAEEKRAQAAAAAHAAKVKAETEERARAAAAEFRAKVMAELDAEKARAASLAAARAKAQEEEERRAQVEEEQARQTAVAKARAQLEEERAYQAAVAEAEALRQHENDNKARAVAAAKAKARALAQAAADAEHELQQEVQAYETATAAAAVATGTSAPAGHKRRSSTTKTHHSSHSLRTEVKTTEFATSRVAATSSETLKVKSKDKSKSKSGGGSGSSAGGKKTGSSSSRNSTRPFKASGAQLDDEDLPAAIKACMELIIRKSKQQRGPLEWGAEDSFA